MKALHKDGNGGKDIGTRIVRRRQVEGKVVGSSLSIRLNDGEPLVVRDPCPILGAQNRSVAFGTFDSQVVIHSMRLERRRGPMVCPITPLPMNSCGRTYSTKPLIVPASFARTPRH